MASGIEFWVYTSDTRELGKVCGFEVRGTPGVDVVCRADGYEYTTDGYGLCWMPLPKGTYTWSAAGYTGKVTLTTDEPVWLIIDTRKGLVWTCPAPTLSVSPTTVEAKGPITISWSGFKDGYWVYVDFLSGPPEFLPPGESYPITVFRVGNTASGSLDTIAPWKDGTYTWQAWQDVTGLRSNIVTVTVTAPPPPTYPTRISISAPDKVSVGEVFIISGKLEYQKDTAWYPLAGRTVSLYRDSILIGSVTTGSDGSYSRSTSISASGTYTLKAVFAGEESSAYVTVAGYSLPETMLSSVLGLTPVVAVGVMLAANEVAKTFK